VAIKLKLADIPEDATWPQVYGVSLLCGIGFTMSLFIGLLAFPTSPELDDQVKVGVLVGSLLSALVGTIVQLSSCPEQQVKGRVAEQIV
jgi:NhaA family Na+:H+ antiporter